MKLIRRTFGFSANSSPIFEPSPAACVTTLSTPAGRPASSKISAQSSPPDERRVLGRLQHDRVARDQRRRDRTRRQDQRRVPRGDRGDDADRPTDPHRERPGIVGRDHLADRGIGESGGLAEEPRDEAHLEHREAEGAARLVREERDDLVAAPLQDVGRGEEDALSDGRRGRRPRPGMPRRRPPPRAWRRRASPAAMVPTTSPVYGFMSSKVLPVDAGTHDPADVLTVMGRLGGGLRS